MTKIVIIMILVNSEREATTTRSEQQPRATLAEMPGQQEWMVFAHESLRTAGHRRGGARQAVIDFLAKQSCCVTAQEVFDGVRAGGDRAGIASVYRVLDELLDLQLVQRVEAGDGVARYEVVAPGGQHHHHLVCASCGRLEPFEDAGLEQALVRAATAVGYDMDGHEVVLRGRCADCRS